jgi:hypothetical protein
MIWLISPSTFCLNAANALAPPVATERRGDQKLTSERRLNLWKQWGN